MLVPSIWFVVAAYNEGPKIREVVSAALTAGNVVVVDDGSRDDTGASASDAGAHVLRHMINRGQGAALQTGIDYALRRGASHIVTFDADGQHRVEDAVQMISHLDLNELDVVLGSRFRGRALNMPLTRRLVLLAAVVFTNLSTGLRLTDTHNGLRVLSRRAAERIVIRQDRMAHASEILHIIADQKLRYAEVPVTIEYSAYSMRKGQRLGNATRILEDMFMQGLHR